MRKRTISQEGLKSVACVLMLIDHIGAVLLPQYIVLRIIGRLSFPIFCFLLAEGAVRTRDPKRYLLRLLAAALLSEIPFDLAFYGRIGLAGQNVMWTLLLGCAMLAAAQKTGVAGKCMLAVVFALGAELLRTDYGGYGIAMITLFALSRERKWAWLIRGIGLAVIGAVMNSGTLYLCGLRIPIQSFCALAVIPIALYQGKKHGHSRWVQWGFYLFYPAHLMVLYFLAKG